MYKFTAQDAREIVATESFTSRGYVIDQIKKAARNEQESITIPDLHLSEMDKKQFITDGFKFTGKSISWRGISSKMSSK